MSLFTPFAFVTRIAEVPIPFPSGSPLLYVNPSIAPSGNTVPDQSGNNNNGTMINATYNSSGIKRYQFNGTNAYITYGDIGDTYTDFTAIAWVTDNDVNGRRSILAKWDDGGDQRSWLIMNESNNNVTFGASKNGQWSPNNAYVQSGFDLSSSWKMVTCRYQYSTGTFYIAVSNTTTWNNESTTGAWTTPQSNVGFYNATKALTQGFQQPGGDERYWSGDMGHILIYNNSFLSDAACASAFANTKAYYGY